MASGRHLPSILGCAVGFCAAGSGVGSLVGTFLQPWLCPPLPAGQGTPEEQVLALYAGTLLGIKVGMAVGAAAGVLYAALVRRARRRERALDAALGAAPDPGRTGGPGGS